MLSDPRKAIATITPWTSSSFVSVLLCVWTLTGSGLAADGEISLENLRIPRDQIVPGGPPKDGIPALTDPAVVEGKKARSMRGAERVIGVGIAGEHRAYPLGILAWHEIVNDAVGGTPIAITYCPLCDSAVAFERTIKGRVLEFGVSGLLYQSNVLMYDRSEGAQSLWSQMAGRAVSGPFSGTRLSFIPVELTTWGQWYLEHPETTVLSTDTGHTRRYDHDPYEDYFRRPGLMFPVTAIDQRLPAKSRILGVEVGGEAKAYPIPDPNPARGVWKDTLGAQTLQFETDPNSGNIRVVDPPAEARVAYALWYAWYAFHQDTKVHSHPQ